MIKVIYFGDPPEPLEGVDPAAYKEAIVYVLSMFPSMKDWVIGLENKGQIDGIDPNLQKKTAVIWPRSDKTRKWIEEEFEFHDELNLLFYVAHEISHVCIAHVTGRLLEGGGTTGITAEDLSAQYWREEGLVNDMAKHITLLKQIENATG